MSNWSKMSKSNKTKWLVMLALTPILIYIIYGTDLLAPTNEYVRLKDGTEFHNVPVRYPSDIDVVIDGHYYTIYDIDSLVR